MHDEILAALSRQDKGNAMELSLKALEQGVFTVPKLYETVLAPSLNQMQASEKDMADLIWQEHRRSAIVRSIVEACYPHVLKARETENTLIDRRVMVLCPEQEAHELGARMVADFFLIAGYQVTYLGADTPAQTLEKALATVKPQDLCLSVSNSYNLFAAKKLTDKLRQSSDQKLRVIVGGHAFAKNPQACQDLGADRILQSFADIQALRREDNS